MTDTRSDQIVEQAKRELEEEQFREEVNLTKEKLRNKTPFFHKLFPFKITITKR